MSYRSFKNQLFSKLSSATLNLIAYWHSRVLHHFLVIIPTAWLRWTELSSKILTISCFFLVLLYFDSLEPSTPVRLVDLFLVTIAILPVALIGGLTTASCKVERKKRRDGAAQEILTRVFDGKTPDYLFYIRRFYSDTGLLIPEKGFSLFSILRWADVRSEDQVEDLILSGLPREDLALKIGATDDVTDFGLGAVPFDREDKECWWAAFKKLTPAARVLVTVPLVDDDSDLLREIDWIKRQGYLEKLVMIMPPNTKVQKQHLHKEYDSLPLAEIWNASRTKLAQELGLTIPSYVSQGGLVVFDDNEFVLHSWIGGRSWRTKNSLRAVIEKARLRPGSWRSALQFGIMGANHFLLGILLAIALIATPVGFFYLADYIRNLLQENIELSTSIPDLVVVFPQLLGFLDMVIGSMEQPWVLATTCLICTITLTLRVSLRVLSGWRAFAGVVLIHGTLVLVIQTLFFFFRDELLKMFGGHESSETFSLEAAIPPIIIYAIWVGLLSLSSAPLFGPEKKLCFPNRHQWSWPE